MTLWLWGLVFLCFTCCNVSGFVKVVTGGFQSGGTWVETGNRLPDNWTPLPLGVCVAETPSLRPLQAVGYGGDGTTCNFQNYYAAMPQLHRDGYIIAASQDVYNGFHMPDDFTLTPRSPLAGPVRISSLIL
jgi:hypothetical protein